MRSKMYSWRMQIIHKAQSVTPSFSIVSYNFFIIHLITIRESSLSPVIIEQLRVVTPVSGVLHLREKNNYYYRSRECPTICGARFRFKPFISLRSRYFIFAETSVY